MPSWKRVIVSGSDAALNSLIVTTNVDAQSFTGSLLGTSSLSISSSYYPVSFTGSSLVSSDTSGINTTGAVTLGVTAGQNSTNSTYLVAIGQAAGQTATTSPFGVMIGVSAGNQASNAEYAVMIGRWAGVQATNASSSVMLGREAGRLSTNATLATFVGPYAGKSATNASSSVMIGKQAGENATEANRAVFIGDFAGQGAVNANNSTFIGRESGYNASNANNSIFLGTAAGSGATNANASFFMGPSAGAGAINAVQSLFFGNSAGNSAAAATLSVFIGNEAGSSAVSASYSTFIGNLSGQTATSASFSTFVGRSSGYQATKANKSVFLGSTAGQQATFANNATFVGFGAGETAASASYSILIGNYAGATSTAANTIGSYNTVIGNGISVPINATRALNIGGLIFGTGSYASPNLDAFSGSANGRIGINQPTPQKEFDISGSIRVSQLSTSLTAPVTSGTTKMVITDANGDLSFTDVPAGGSITIADEGTSQGTATFLNFTGAGVTATVSSNTASISITGGGTTTYYNSVTTIDQSGGTSDTYGILTGSINGANTLFTVSKTKYVSGSLKVFLNGQLLTQGTAEDWYEADPSVGTFYFVSASRPQTNDLVTAEYIEYVTTQASTTTSNTLQVVNITGSTANLALSSGSLSTYYRINTTNPFDLQIDTNANKPGIPTGSQIIIEKLITGSLTITPQSGVSYTGSLYIPYQYQTVTLTKVGTDEWKGEGGYDNLILSFNSQSSTAYTLVKEDVGEMIRLNNASPITVTIPPNSSEAFPIGAIVSLEQQGAGVITCVTGSGVTINSTARKTWGQYTVIQVYKVATDTWNVIGGVE